MKPLTINGRKLPCDVCRRHRAKVRFEGLLLCRKCTKGVCLGYLSAKASVYKIREGKE